MSKHAEFESLAREQRWQDFCRAFPLSQWCAMPMPDAAPEAHVADLRADAQQQAPLVMPEALVGTLSAELLMAQLQRELLRQARSGSNLSLLCAALSERRRLCVALGEGTVKRLERLLAESLRNKLEACDSMGAAQGALSGRALAGRFRGTGPAAVSHRRHFGGGRSAVRPGRRLRGTGRAARRF